jgi:hypothetical protein
MLEDLIKDLSSILRPCEGELNQVAGQDSEEVAQATAGLETAEAQLRAPKASHEVLSW